MRRRLCGKQSLWFCIKRVRSSFTNRNFLTHFFVSSLRMMTVIRIMVLLLRVGKRSGSAIAKDNDLTFHPMRSFIKGSFTATHFGACPMDSKLSSIASSLFLVRTRFSIRNHSFPGVISRNRTSIFHVSRAFPHTSRGTQCRRFLQKQSTICVIRTTVTFGSTRTLNRSSEAHIFVSRSLPWKGKMGSFSIRQLIHRRRPTINRPNLPNFSHIRFVH